MIPHFLFSALLSFAGLAAALAALIAAAALLRAAKGIGRLPPACWIGVSAAYGLSQAAGLARWQSGLACALALPGALALSGALLLLHLAFLWGALRRLRQIPA